MTLRTYLDWNASAPLRPEARRAMHEATEITGNPSAVHAEGRAARALIEDARERIAGALGAEGAEIVFTSGASEAAALALAGRDLAAAAVEHPAVAAWCRPDLAVDGNGQADVADPGASTLQLANSETGVMQALPDGLAVSDLTQAAGKVALSFDTLGCAAGILSAHKLGGPKGVGALLLAPGTEVAARILGGGQEKGRRAGTENIIGIAGFAAAAEAAARDISAGLWEEVGVLRNILENLLADAARETIFVGQGARRLPNTSLIATPGWKGETQVMQMDLAGFATSAGPACSSGRTRRSGVLAAMGLKRLEGCALRVSLGPGTHEKEIRRFAGVWCRHHERFRARAG